MPAEAPTLRADALGTVDATLIGVSSVAPAYSLAAILGPLVAAVGVQAPAVLLVAFAPMLLVAGAYYWCNRADPDCGTTFAWAARALGPRTGWLAGWSILVAGVVVIGLLADTAATYALELAGLAGAVEARWPVVACAGLAMLAATWVTARGVELSARVTRGLVGLQVVGLLLFVAATLGRVALGDGPPTAAAPTAAWLDPTGVASPGAFAVGALLAVFAYWGWDSAVAVCEETREARRAPGRAAILATVALLGLYELVAVGALAWLGPQGLAAFADERALAAIAGQALPAPLDSLVSLAVVCAALAAAQTTILPSSRTALSMARQGAAPARLARVHSGHGTPARATWLVGGLAVAYYVAVAGLFDAFYASSLLVLGLLVCVNYGLNALACVVLHRRAMWRSPVRLVTMGVGPLVGSGLFLALLVRSLADLAGPDGRAAGVWLGVPAPLLVAGAVLVGGMAGAEGLRLAGHRAFFARPAGELPAGLR